MQCYRLSGTATAVESLYDTGVGVTGDGGKPPGEQQRSAQDGPQYRSQDDEQSDTRRLRLGLGGLNVTRDLQRQGEEPERQRGAELGEKVDDPVIGADAIGAALGL